MKNLESIQQFQAYRQSITSSVGFIPTMGALHAGHLSLIKQSLSENDHTIVSIFVNPTQFDNKNDLNKYPNLIESDLQQLHSIGVDCALLPKFDQMYPDNYRYKVSENELSQQFCGAHREGHFDGVLTVVMKLFNIVQPNKAYFGEKDFQQLTLIKQMVQAFFMPIEVVAGATVREQDGLAMSSRNLNLTAEQRKIAPKLYQTISTGDSLKQMHNDLEAYGFKIDYLEILDNRLLVAAFLGTVRLIDNIEINPLEKVA